MYTDEIKSML